MCVFATHDVTQDPPFSKLDLVTREEYEVLAQRLDKLEGRIAALEEKK